MSEKNEKLEKKIQKKLYQNKYVKDILKEAGLLKVEVFIVGGAVRDIIMGGVSFDYDFVMDTNPSLLVYRLTKKWQTNTVHYPDFGTFVLKLEDSNHIDFATAREEKYPKAGALPKVKFSNIQSDLKRRDFSINAIAFSLNGKDAKLIDPSFGIKDIEKRTLRVLHDNSFKDDATRIFRLAKFSARGFKIEKHTLNLALSGIKYIGKISMERIREEIKGILTEKDPFPSLELLYKWGAFKYFFKGIIPKKGIKKYKTIAERLNFLLCDLDEKEAMGILNQLKFERETKNELRELIKKNEKKPILTGCDLIKLGLKQGPQIGKALKALLKKEFTSRHKAKRFIIDNFT